MSEMERIRDVAGVVLRDGRTLMADDSHLFVMYTEGVQEEDEGGATLYGWADIAAVIPTAMPATRVVDVVIDTTHNSTLRMLDSLAEAAFSSLMDEFKKRVDRQVLAFIRGPNLPGIVESHIAVFCEDAVSEVVGRRADMLLCLTPGGKEGCGVWVELGAALALGKFVVLTGENAHRSVFGRLANMVFASDAEALRHIEQTAGFARMVRR